MKHVGLCALGVLFASMLSLPASRLPSYGNLQASPDTLSDAPLKARIVQLEEQLRQTQRSATVCAAQLALATEPAAAKEAQAKMAEAAKDMGCDKGVDWQVVPPVCKAGPVVPHAGGDPESTHGQP